MEVFGADVAVSSIPLIIFHIIQTNYKEQV
jgi:hypothetical protein